MDTAKLDNANLTRTLFYGADLTRAHLLYANLTYTNFDSAVLKKARLIHAKISSISLIRADLTDVDFNYAKWPDDLKAPREWIRDPNSGQLSNPKVPPPRRASKFPVASRALTPEQQREMQERRKQRGKEDPPS
jgi:Pentapeptide repeats (9 copies)